VSDVRSDEVLVGAWRAGDERAFDELYARKRNYVRTIVRDRIGSRRDEDIEDVAQDAWASFVKGFDSKPDGMSFSKSLQMHTQWAATAFLRKQMTTSATIPRQLSDESWERIAGSTPGPPGDESTFAAAVRILEERLMKYLSAKQRTIVRLVYVNGANQSEVAEGLGMSPAAVESSLRRARKRIKWRTGVSLPDCIRADRGA
jgi:RNA polymerase sigma factor (sigma-70 family)